MTKAKYTVHVREVHTEIFNDIEAGSEDEARDIVNQKIAECDNSGELVYHHTLGLEDWPVYKEPS